MTAANFSPSLAFTLRSEGGFSDDPNDPGGATYQGITLTEYRTYIGNPNATVSSLQAMSAQTIESIYWDDYWDVVQGDQLPAGIDLSVFDMAVNAGTVQSVKFLQRIVDTMADGALGPLTLTATLKNTDPLAIISSLYTKQLAFYQSLSTFQYFGKGWTARCLARRQAAIALASQMTSAARGKALVV